MNTRILKNNLIAIGVVCALLSACTSSPSKQEGAESLRNRLTQLQSNPQLGNRAPLAMKEADEAVTRAEKPEKDHVVSAHLMFMAGRKIDVAKAQAEGHYAVAERSSLSEQRDAMRLRSRTLEADSANLRATAAQVDASNQLRSADLARSQVVIAQADALDQRLAASSARDAADTARDEANVARDAASSAQRNSQELQSQINELQAKVTDRGLVLTLGDVLFSSGTAQLNRGGNSHLTKLAAFLNKYPERSALIEGYTDSVGTEDYNQGLSQRRADAVKSYLVEKGILSARMTASGKGENSPVGNNETATGRQQNRRVEVVIENNQVAAR